MDRYSQGKSRVKKPCTLLLLWGLPLYWPPMLMCWLLQVNKKHLFAEANSINKVILFKEVNKGIKRWICVQDKMQASSEWQNPETLHFTSISSLEAKMERKWTTLSWKDVYSVIRTFCYNKPDILLTISYNNIWKVPLFHLFTLHFFMVPWIC